MNLRYVFLIIILGLVLIPSQSFSLLVEQSPEELYQSHHTIVIGKIISSEMISERETLYQIKVTEPVKNSQKDEIISAVGNGIDCSKVEMCTRTSIDRVFAVGDKVILYLNHGLGNFEISPYSRIISPYEDDIMTSEFAISDESQVPSIDINSENISNSSVVMDKEENSDFDRQNFLTGKPVNIITSADFRDTGDTRSLVIILIESIGVIMIVFFIVFYAIKKRRAKQSIDKTKKI